MAQTKQLTVDAEKAEALEAISKMSEGSLKILQEKIEKRGIPELEKKLNTFKALI